MKRTAADGTFLDYTTENSGVRVWRDSCAVICREPDGEWSERGLPHPIPVDPPLIDMPLHGPDSVHPLALELARYEATEQDAELRQLITRRS